MFSLFNLDYLQALSLLPENSVDLVIVDPPYGTTNAEWDVPFNFDEMWIQLDRVCKDNAAIVVFGIEPFSSELRISNKSCYKYDWIWEKTAATGHLNSKIQPLRAHELISVFYKKQPTYNAQKSTGHSPVNSFTKTVETANNTQIYNKTSKVVKGGGSTERFPRSVLKFKSDKQTEKHHPTQKPIALLEYLIRTYSNENNVVLDFAMGSGSTGVACKNTSRRFIGIDSDTKFDFFEIAAERLSKAGAEVLNLSLRGENV